MEGTFDHIRHHHHVQGARQLEQPILSARSWQSSRSVDIDMTSSTTTIATSCTTTVFLQPIDEIEQVNDLIKHKQHPVDEAGAETATAEEFQYKVIARLSSHFVDHSYFTLRPRQPQIPTAYDCGRFMARSHPQKPHRRL
jgi:hypothetical protein